MSKMITWHQYFILIGGLTLLYYAIILLLYYRREMETLFNRRPISTNLAEQNPANKVQLLLGEPEFDGQQTIGAEELFFAAPDEDEEPEQTAVPNATPAPNESFLLGPVADFLKELKSNFSLLKEAQGDKEEFLTLLGILSEKYSQVMQCAYRPLLEVFILELATEQLPFELTSADLQIQSIQQ